MLVKLLKSYRDLYIKHLALKNFIQYIPANADLEYNLATNYYFIKIIKSITLLSSYTLFLPKIIPLS